MEPKTVSGKRLLVEDKFLEEKDSSVYRKVRQGNLLLQTSYENYCKAIRTQAQLNCRSSIRSRLDLEAYLKKIEEEKKYYTMTNLQRLENKVEIQPKVRQDDFSDRMDTPASAPPVKTHHREDIYNLEYTKSVRRPRLSCRELNMRRIEMQCKKMENRQRRKNEPNKNYPGSDS